MDFKVLSHSSILFEHEGLNIYFDPYEVSDECHDADIVFITHDHFDHYSLNDLIKVCKEDTIVIAPKSISIDKMMNAMYVDANESHSIKGIEFRAIHSYNDKRRFHKRENGYLGYVLSIDGKDYYVMGDCDLNEDNLEVKCDYLFIPIGGTYTFDYLEAIKYIKITRPKYTIPHHLKFLEHKDEVLKEFEKMSRGLTEVITK